MPKFEFRFVFKGFQPTPEFEAFANERLTAVVHTGPFGCSCAAEIEYSAKSGYKTTIKMIQGASNFSGVNAGTDLELCMQRCLGQVRAKTFKWRKDKLAQKNKPHELTAEEQADPFLRMKKKMYTG